LDVVVLVTFNEPVVKFETENEDTVIFDTDIFVKIPFTALARPVEILVFASKVAVVNPVVRIIDEPVALVNTRFVIDVFVLANCPDVIFVAIILDVLNTPLTFKDALEKLLLEIFVADNVPVEILVDANKVSVVIPVVKTRDATVILENNAFETVILFAAILAVVILLVANRVPVVNPVLNIMDVPLAFVNNIFELVRVTVATFALVILVKLPLPFTSNV